MVENNKKKEKYVDLEKKGARLDALLHVSKEIRDRERRTPIPFNDFLYSASQQPERTFRDIFQLFFDMINHYIPEGNDEYEITSESIGFINYNADKLFIEGHRNPFFADRLFANRLMNLAKTFKQRSQVNYIYLFEGPPGSGKSTFLNNLLQKFEEYTHLQEGTIYETFWSINVEFGYKRILQRISNFSSRIQNEEFVDQIVNEARNKVLSQKDLDIACPNHDHPILQIPREYRKNFLDELIADEEFKQKLFNSKEYEWVLRDVPCNICKTVYDALMDDLGDPLEVLSMLHARKALFNRQMGEGISVFNPGDQMIREPINNQSFQNIINDFLQTDTIKFIYSSLAKTNNGVYALMDIKENNIQRLKNLHGVISDRVHKVEFIEEYVKSLFVGLINPEDKNNYENVKSFKDRVITVKIPYILDYKTEVEIYKNKFGKSIEQVFLPGVLENFAKIIISTRLNAETPTIKKWIKNSGKYNKYVDSNLYLLKMEIYTGNIPDWLDDEDIKGFTKNIRKEILLETEKEGQSGISGRQSINIFNSFFNKYTREGKLITMDNVKKFFQKHLASFGETLPTGFMVSVEKLYNYNVLQQVKEAIYDYNEDQINRDILNYLYAINYEVEQSVVSSYTNDKLDITEEFFFEFERKLLGISSIEKTMKDFRNEQQRLYVRKTVAQELRLEGKDVIETDQFLTIKERLIRNLKENALAPFIENENFRRAIQDFGSKKFQKYDSRLKKDVNFLIQNLKSKFNYTQTGAKQISLYIIDQGMINK